MKWTGKLAPPTTGTYQFALTSDDGSRLFVNGQQVIDNWSNQPPTTQTASVALTAGQPVDVEVDYYQDGGGSQVSLGWQIPDQNLHDQAVAAARAAQLAVVFVSNGEGEGGDLGGIDLSGDQNKLVTDVAAANPNTVVVVNSGSAVTMPWADAVRGIVENWYPGEEDGTAIAALLYGDVDFSGKLPVTFPQTLADVPASTTGAVARPERQRAVLRGRRRRLPLVRREEQDPAVPVRLRPVLHDLRLHQPHRRDAGLLRATSRSASTSPTPASGPAPRSPRSTSASRPSTGEPPKNLRGFTRVALDPGQTKHATVTLDARSFQYWGGSRRHRPSGTNRILVGSSSRDIRLTGQVGLDLANDRKGQT